MAGFIAEQAQSSAEIPWPIGVAQKRQTAEVETRRAWNRRSISHARAAVNSDRGLEMISGQMNGAASPVPLTALRNRTPNKHVAFLQQT